MGLGGVAVLDGAAPAPCHAHRGATIGGQAHPPLDWAGPGRQLASFPCRVWPAPQKRPGEGLQRGGVLGRASSAPARSIDSPPPGRKSHPPRLGRTRVSTGEFLRSDLLCPPEGPRRLAFGGSCIEVCCIGPCIAHRQPTLTNKNGPLPRLGPQLASLAFRVVRRPPKPPAMGFRERRIGLCCYMPTPPCAHPHETKAHPPRLDRAGPPTAPKGRTLSTGEWLLSRIYRRPASRGTASQRAPPKAPISTGEFMAHAEAGSMPDFWSPPSARRCRIN